MTEAEMNFKSLKIALDLSPHLKSEMKGDVMHITCDGDPFITVHQVNGTWEDTQTWATELVLEHLHEVGLAT